MSRPLLWHLPVSHYSEKVRWALDHKRVAHRRRALIGGVHIPIAMVLTRGRQYTLPLLELEGRTIGDSTAIIAALEEAYPEPPLYPADPDERRRALELEDWFDEQLGPYIRRFVFHALRGERELFDELAACQIPVPLRRYRRRGGRLRPRLHRPALPDRWTTIAPTRRAPRCHRRARPAGVGTRRGRVPRRRPLYGCGPDRGGAVLPARDAARGTAPDGTAAGPGRGPARRSRTVAAIAGPRGRGSRPPAGRQPGASGATLAQVARGQ